MTTANIVFLIDIQEGFGNKTLTFDQGGVLYVPEGEKADAPAANLITQARDTIFVLSADYHPDTMLSDVSNHPGVLAYRQAQAEAVGYEESTLPFTNVKLREDANGHYHVVGVVEGARVLAVETQADGYVSKVLRHDAAVLPTDMTQTLWPRHCVQGSPSALFLPQIMKALPASLADRLRRHEPGELFSHEDAETGNSFFIVRKGMRRDVDSNAIAIENNQKTMTAAPRVFRSIAQTLLERKATSARVAIGGLAGNICAEVSHNDVCNLFVPPLKDMGLEVQVSFMTDISQMIPIAIPDGSFPDAANTLGRLARFGTVPTTTEAVARAIVQRLPLAPRVKDLAL